MPIFDEIDIDLLAMVLGDDLQDAGMAYELVEVPGTGSSTLKRYRPVLELPHLSLSPAGANPREVVRSGVQEPLAVWILSLPRGVTLQANWVVRATIGIGNCERTTWLNVIGPEHPRSSEVLSRWLVGTLTTAPQLV